VVVAIVGHAVAAFARADVEMKVFVAILADIDEANQ
jgi:hypothetical protein